MMALLKSLGSKHMWRDPSGSQEYVKEDTHSVGSETGVIIPWSTISCRSFLIASLQLNGDLSSSVLNWEEGGI